MARREGGGGKQQGTINFFPLSSFRGPLFFFFLFLSRWRESTRESSLGRLIGHYARFQRVSRRCPSVVDLLAILSGEGGEDLARSTASRIGERARVYLGR